MKSQFQFNWFCNIFFCVKLKFISRSKLFSHNQFLFFHSTSREFLQQLVRIRFCKHVTFQFKASLSFAMSKQQQNHSSKNNIFSLHVTKYQKTFCAPFLFISSPTIFSVQPGWRQAGENLSSFPCYGITARWKNRFHLTNNICDVLNKLCFSLRKSRKFRCADHDKLCEYKHDCGCQIRLKF